MMLTVGAPFTISADGVDHNRLVCAIIKGDQGVPKVVSCQRICGEHKAARSCGLFNIVEMPSYIDHLNIVPVGIGG